MWDWWWYPFDLVPVVPTTTVTSAAPVRPYRTPNGQTPPIEYYYDEDHHQAPFVLDDQHSDRIQDGIHGPESSPTTFRLDNNSPVYALANGELVAARYSALGSVSMSFVLVRHEVFHQQAAAPVGPRLDYDVDPDWLYTLYMHLAFTAVTDFHFDVPDAANPDWLNRVLIRMRECDLVDPFHTAHAGHTGHPGDVPDAVWNGVRPGSAQRPSMLTALQADRTAYRDFLTALQAGRVATAPVGPGVTRMNVLLGDYLGRGGVIPDSSGHASHGMRVEVFSPTWHIPGFVTIQSWNASLPNVKPLVQTQSEWARTPAGAEATTLTTAGVDLTLVPWWATVQAAVAVDGQLAAGAALPVSGIVNHYKLFDVMNFLNPLTWASEWPKYQATDGAGAAIAQRTVPPSRRI